MFPRSRHFSRLSTANPTMPKSNGAMDVSIDILTRYCQNRTTNYSSSKFDVAGFARIQPDWLNSEFYANPATTTPRQSNKLAATEIGVCEATPFTKMPSRIRAGHLGTGRNANPQQIRDTTGGTNLNLRPSNSLLDLPKRFAAGARRDQRLRRYR